MTRVILLDDDKAVRDSISRLLKSGGVTSEVCGCSAELFESLERSSDVGCIVLDVRLKLENGVEVLQRLRSKYPQVAVIMISGQSDIPIAVESMRHGAFDFLEKPFRPQVLLDQIARALEWSTKKHTEGVLARDFKERRSRLTPREEDVIELLLEGLSCKEIAFRFELSSKTVHIHRSRILARMDCESVVTLVRNYRDSLCEGAQSSQA